MSRRLITAIDIDGAGQHPGAWRGSETDPAAILTGELALRAVQRAEAAGVDLATFADTLEARWTTSPGSAPEWMPSHWLRGSRRPPIASGWSRPSPRHTPNRSRCRLNGDAGPRPAGLAGGDLDNGRGRRRDRASHQGTAAAPLASAASASASASASAAASPVSAASAVSVASAGRGSVGRGAVLPIPGGKHGTTST